MPGLRAILVSVDYADILELTLPWNRHHFDSVMVVTNIDDRATVRVASDNNCEVFATDSFYDDGAHFNKWKALEMGLDAFGRSGWLCVMDADVLWPRDLRVEHQNDYPDCIGIGPCSPDGRRFLLKAIYKGQLCTPHRRIFPDLSGLSEAAPELAPRLPRGLPPEDQWGRFAIHRNSTKEWPGYSQIFHADDPALGPPPWHQIDWEHAGGADSFFQFKWDPKNKVRPPFEVLHLGEPGVNWYGRSSARLDGTRHPEADERRRLYMDIWRKRRERRAKGLDAYGGERLRTPEKPPDSPPA